MAYQPANINFGEVLLRALENQKRLKLDEKQADIQETRARTTEEYMKRQQLILQKQLENEQKQTSMAEARARMEGMSFEDMFTPQPINALPKELQPYAKGYEMPKMPGYILKKDIPGVTQAWQVEVQGRSNRDPWLEMQRMLAVQAIQAQREFTGAQDVLRQPSTKGGISLGQIGEYRTPYAKSGQLADPETMLEEISPAYEKRQASWAPFKASIDPDVGAGGLFDLLDPVMSTRKEYGGRNFAEMFNTIGSIGGQQGMIPDQDILDQGASALFALESVQRAMKDGKIQGGNRSVWNPQTTLEEDVRTAISMIKPRLEQYSGQRTRAIDEAMQSQSVVRQRMILDAQQQR